MARILSGPGGNAAPDIVSSLKTIKELGLDAQEIEFVRGVTMGEKKAKEVGSLAKELGLRLSIHAPYYINLLSSEEHKVEASKKRILDSCRRGHYLGADSIVFHPGYYQKRNKHDSYEIVRDQIKDLLDVIKKEKLQVSLCPETTGKKSQFGDVDELLQLMQDTGCKICVDFAHIFARQNGKIDYDDIFRKFTKNKLKRLHCHFSGIEYSEKGETNHIQMTDEFLKPLLEAAAKTEIELTIINESPDPLHGAIDLKVLASAYGL
ncbi:MAG: TIM barrel protein [Candidatus Woesearchaeota archaeon]